MRKILAGACAALMFLSPLSWAAEFKDGNTPSNGVAPGSQAVGGWDGASQRTVRVDASGILRTTEEYKTTRATANPFTAANAVPVTTGLSQIGAGWSAYPYGNRSLYVKRTATGGSSVDVMHLFLFASDDDVSYYPVLNPSAFSSTFVIGDTTKVDTVMVSLPSSPVTFEGVFSLPIETYGYMGKYLAIYARRNGGATTQALTLVWMGREK